MPGSCSRFLLSASGHKVATPLSPKYRCHARKSKKWPDPNFAAAVVSGPLSAFASPESLSALAGPGSLFVAFEGSNPATAGLLGVANFTAASAYSGNLVGNCVDLLQSWLTLPKYRSYSSLSFFSAFFLSLFVFLSLCFFDSLQPSCRFERFL